MFLIRYSFSTYLYTLKMPYVEDTLDRQKPNLEVLSQLNFNRSLMWKYPRKQKLNASGVIGFVYFLCKND